MFISYDNNSSATHGSTSNIVAGNYDILWNKMLYQFSLKKAVFKFPNGNGMLSPNSELWEVKTSAS